MVTDDNYNPDVPVRFYQDKYPSEGDVVMAIFTKVDDMVAEVILPEYANHQAIIPFSELSRRRIKRADRTAKLGQKQPCLVTKVDTIKGYIDVSKTKVEDSGFKEFEHKYSKNAMSIGLVKEFYKTFYKPSKFNKEAFEDLCNKTIWALDRHKGQNGSAYDFLKLAVSDSKVLGLCKQLTEEERECFSSIIVSKLSPKSIKIRSDVDLVCRRAGVEALIDSFQKGQKCALRPDKIRIAIVSPPKYFIECSGYDKAELEQELMRVIDGVSKSVAEYGGKFAHKEPKIIGAIDDKLFEINEAINGMVSENSSEEDSDEYDEEDSEAENKENNMSDSSSSIG